MEENVENAISYTDLEFAHDDFTQDAAAKIAKNAVTSQGIRKVARVCEAVAKNTTVFDVEVKQGERCDQKRSGRCWMFASLNCFRNHVIKKYNLETFELSQAYPLFWDKLEKANWFLSNILDTLDEPLDGRLMQFLLSAPVEDGGQWDMFKALVNKYGVCPKEAMPETACSSNTTELDRYLTRYLRSCAARLREAHEQKSSQDELREMKKQICMDVYRILAISLGEPPKTFDVRLRDKDNNIVVNGTFTPQSFMHDIVGINVNDYVSIISAPTQDKPFNHTYTVDRLGNVVEAGGVRYLNLECQDMKELAIKQLKNDMPVWFGCDVSQSYLQDEGIMDLDALDVDGLFGLPIEQSMNRAQRLDYGESLMTHAMVLEGVNLSEGKPTLWKVENSWGKDHGKNGFDSIADSWFDEYVYQIVIDKQFLSEEQRHIFETEQPTVLKPWDPMGALANIRA